MARIFILSGLTFILWSTLPLVLFGELAANAQEVATDELHVWYDGDIRHEVHVRSDLIAEFNNASANRADRTASHPGDRTSGRADKSTDEASASGTSLQKAGVGNVFKQAGSIKIYKVSNAVALQNFQKLNATQTRQSLSPVFSDSPNSAVLRALPGGVIVTFREPRDETWIRDWATRNRLVFDRILSHSSRTIALFKTNAGLESLDTANRIRQLDAIQSASPNWWTEKWKDGREIQTLSSKKQLKQYEDSRRKSSERFGHAQIQNQIQNRNQNR